MSLERLSREESGRVLATVIRLAGVAEAEARAGLARAGGAAGR